MEQRFRLFDEPALVFDRINSADRQERQVTVDLRKSLARFSTMILLIRTGEYAVWLYPNSLGGMTLAEETRLFFVTSDDGIGVG